MFIKAQTPLPAPFPCSRAYPLAPRGHSHVGKFPWEPLSSPSLSYTALHPGTWVLGTYQSRYPCACRGVQNLPCLQPGLTSVTRLDSLEGQGSKG